MSTKQKQNSPSKNFDLVARQVREGTPETVVELIARQVDRANEAKERIEREGSVVRDPKGSVVEHPAIKIEIAATKLAADLLGRSRKL